ncbi:hypothetical protein GQ472_06115 [archaeon]|nr:hypothetical protein [archaeon]
MVISVEIEYCSGNDEINKDRFRFKVLAKRQFVRQVTKGLRPIKASWQSYDLIRSRRGIVIPPMDILITVRQYSGNVMTEMHTYNFSQTDEFDDCMRPVLEMVKIWLRPRHHELICSSCGKRYRSVNQDNKLCKSCWNKGLRQFVYSVSDTVAEKTKGLHRSKGTVAKSKRLSGIPKPDKVIDEDCNQSPVKGSDEIKAGTKDESKAVSNVDIPPDITVPDKTGRPEPDTEPVMEPDKELVKRKQGRPRKVPVTLHDCSCLICDKPFQSENPKAIKCKECTVSAEEIKMNRLVREERVRLRAERRKSTQKFNGEF